MSKSNSQTAIVTGATSGIGKATATATAKALFDVNFFGTIRMIASLLQLLPGVFQPGQSQGLNARFHFTFTGAENRKAAITIRDRKLEIQEGHIGQSDLRMTADSKT